MRKLETIQTQANLNRVFAIDEIGPGGAYHEYEIKRDDTGETLATIQLQKGPRKEPDSIHGVLDVDLLEIVRDRMKAFQAGPFACDYNARALEGVEAALTALNDRVEDRLKRDVLSKNEK